VFPSGRTPAEQAMLDEIRRMRQSGIRSCAESLHQGHRTRRGSAWQLARVARITKQAKVAR
jgi:hypothetical protein